MRICYLGDSVDRHSSSLLGCALWIRDFIIKYNLGGKNLNFGKKTSITISCPNFSSKGRGIMK
jgi:hypothetical protein